MCRAGFAGFFDISLSPESVDSIIITKQTKYSLPFYPVSNFSSESAPQPQSYTDDMPDATDPYIFSHSQVPYTFVRDPRYPDVTSQAKKSPIYQYVRTCL
ncbi:hypothetical protein P4377_24945 [Bacillus thuringiensis]|nr:hypothetical protein [Bacillus thuringiensis]